MQILLSVKPEFVEKIFNGEKRYEFRKQIPKQPVDKVFIYESSPTQHIVGWFSVSQVINGHPDDIWKTCKSQGGIGENRYFEYCNGNKMIHAFKINEVHKFERPINPFEKDADFTPPQNFVYFKKTNTIFNELENCSRST